MDKQLESNLNFVETVAGMVAIATEYGTGILAIHHSITPHDTFEVCVQMNEATWRRYFGEQATHAEDRPNGNTALWARHRGRWYMCLADKEAEA